MKPSWPTGLRVVFGLVLLGFLVSTGQLAYYLLMLRISPDDLGQWVFIGYAMSYITIMLGGFRLRRPFTILLTLGCLYSIPFTVFQTWPLIHDFWQGILSGGISIGRILTWDMWCLTWNTICLSLDIGVLLYLLSYEFKFFGPGKVERKVS